MINLAQTDPLWAILVVFLILLCVALIISSLFLIKLLYDIRKITKLFKSIVDFLRGDIGSIKEISNGGESFIKKSATLILWVFAKLGEKENKKKESEE